MPRRRARCSIDFVSLSLLLAVLAQLLPLRASEAGLHQR
jgi:hypothetical protein